MEVVTGHSSLAHVMFFADSTHHFPLLWEKVGMEKMGTINTFEPVLINGQCIGYMLADHS